MLITFSRSNHEVIMGTCYTEMSIGGLENRLELEIRSAGRE